MSSPLITDSNTDVVFKRMPSGTLDKITQYITSYIKSKATATKVSIKIGQIFDVTYENQYVIRLESKNQQVAACQGKIKFVFLDEKDAKGKNIKHPIDVEQVSAGDKYFEKNPPPADDTPLSTNPDDDFTTHGGRKPKHKNPAGPGNTPRHFPGSEPAGPSNIGGGSGDTPSKPTPPDWSNLKISDDKKPGSSSKAKDIKTREIEVTTQRSRMTHERLHDMFRSKVGGSGPLTSGMQSSAITNAWEEDEPPRFELRTAKQVRDAVGMYNGKHFGEFGFVYLKPVEPKVRAAAPPPQGPGDGLGSVQDPGDASDTTQGNRPKKPVSDKHIRPPPPVGATTPPKSVQLGPRKFADTLRTQRNFTLAKPRLPSDGPSEVLANYVQIKNWPSIIFEYTIDFGEREIEKKDGSGTRMEKVTRLVTKKSILKAIRDHPPLQGQNWATDNDSIWSLKQLWDHEHEGLTKVVGAVHYYRQDGRQEESAPTVTITYQRTLRLPAPNARNEFYLATGHDFRERIIQALNAFVSKYADNLATRNGVAQVAPNKFFAHQYFSELGTGRINHLIAHRGFSTSVRPTSSQLLLGITPLTSAFYRPVTVQEWFDILYTRDSGWTNQDGYRNEDEIMRTVIGLKCRLVHNRPQPEEGGPDPNHDDNRWKTITEFGVKFSAQQYEPRGAKGTYLPVSDYFQSIYHLDQNNFDQAFCVNVGAKLNWSDHPRREPNILKPGFPHPICRTGRPQQYSNYYGAVWIPANLLEIAPYQLYSKLLKPDHTAKMLTVACNAPHVNQAWIEGPAMTSLGIRGNLAAAQNWMRPLNLDIDQTLLRVPVQFVEVPTIRYANKSLTASDEEFTQATWNLRDVTFSQPSSVSDLCIIRVGTNQNVNMQHLFRNLQNQFRTHGIQSPRVASGHWLSWNAVTSLNDEGQVKTDMDNHFGLIGQHIYRGQPLDVRASNGSNHKSKSQQYDGNTLFIVVLPRRDPAYVFQAVKRAADYNGLRTICVLSENVDNRGGSYQYISNLCLKVNAKAAMDVHRVDRLTRLTDTIVLGADIGSVKGGHAGCPSIASVVGSVDGNHMNTPGSMRLIPVKQDIIPYETMVEMVTERLNAWVTKNRKLPRNILMYRDGVSQSQYALLLEKSDGSYIDKPEGADAAFGITSKKGGNQRHAQDGEVKAIRDAYGKVAEAIGLTGTQRNPKLTFVVVGKRHNTRFFPTNNWQQVRNGNLFPGAMIESGCTLPNEWPVIDNFFLQSHGVLQGTGRSAHYIVLQDDMGLTTSRNDKNLTPLHEITHALCFAYTEATRGVSYCAPAYHADKLCARGEAYIKRIADSAHSQPYWGDMPQVTQQNPHPMSPEQWYAQVARGLSRDVLWMGNNSVGGRRNPWHTALDVGMFWI